MVSGPGHESGSRAADEGVIYEKDLVWPEVRLNDYYENVKDIWQFI